VTVPMFAVRRLNDSVRLCLFNTFLIGVVLAVALADMVKNGRPVDANHWAISPRLSLMSLFGALTNIIYSMTGQWMYFELMETMRVPDEFPKAFLISGPVMMVCYLTVALLGFFYTSRSDRGDLLSMMEPSPMLRVAAGLLFAHVIVVYLIKSIVLTRFFHNATSPADLEHRTTSSYLKAGGIGCTMLACCYIVANVIPFFDQLLGLIGGLLCAPVNFLIPIGLYVTAKGHQMQAKEKRCKSTLMASVRAGFGALSSWEMVLIAFIVVFVSFASTVGVTYQVNKIIKDWGKFGAPFTCQALPDPREFSLINW